ncbi:MAG: pilus assembly protein PilM, partial [Limisphaerales bacterium]
MVLDIGAKSSNVLFFEDGKVFTRSINIGANAITQEFATEQKMRFPDAEQFKLEQGFVGLGGAYEDPENPQQAAISKIARQVMTRLHIQVNQTIQFYKTQQGGSAPVRLFLAGGASIMPYTSQFFSEKLNIEVDYFNPFQSVGIDPSLDLEELGRLAPSFGTVVGLALRNVFECPVELNLMPRQLRDRQEFNRKKPLVLASVAGLVLLMLLVGFFFRQVAAEKQKVLAQLESDAAPLLRLQDSLRPEESALAT